MVLLRPAGGTSFVPPQGPCCNRGRTAARGPRRMAVSPASQSLVPESFRSLSEVSSARRLSGMTTTTASYEPHDRARTVLLSFVAAATATGAVPVPATSLAIVAENAVMVHAIAATYGMTVDLQSVASSLGVIGSVNLIGRAVFVEAARAMGWFAGPLGVGGVMALGAFTSGMQAWMIGELAVAVCENGGRAIPPDRARTLLQAARADFGVWWSQRERAQSRRAST